MYCCTSFTLQIINPIQIPDGSWHFYCYSKECGLSYISTLKQLGFIGKEEDAFNPIPIGLFRGLESIGGGVGGGGLIWPPPPQISATNGPIDSKIGTVVKQVK